MTPTICCDFDDTLIIHQYEMINGLYGEFCANYSWLDNLIVINELLKYQNKGYEIYIVTYRGPAVYHPAERFDHPPEKHLAYLKEKFGLIFKDVIFTNGECKVPFINNLDAEKHYDDDQNVIFQLTKSSIARPVWIRHERLVSPLMEKLINDKRIDVIDVNYEQTK